MKRNITLDWEQVDAIVAEELKSHYVYLMNDHSYSFSKDKEENEKELNAFREAFKKVLNFYGEKV